jgi:hypothetical protein
MDNTANYSRIDADANHDGKKSFKAHAADAETSAIDKENPESKISNRRILCRFCGHTITHENEAAAVTGKHVHVFLNPAGILFEIACYKRADGCSKIGKYTDEYTWFPGYKWCIVICSSCRAHIGWRYVSGRSFFFGLITENILPSAA